MKNRIGIYIAYSMAWLSTAFAVSVSIYYTKMWQCLFFMLIPACIGIKSSCKSDEEKDNEWD